MCCHGLSRPAGLSSRRNAHDAPTWGHEATKSGAKRELNAPFPGGGSSLELRRQAPAGRRLSPGYRLQHLRMPARLGNCRVRAARALARTGRTPLSVRGPVGCLAEQCGPDRRDPRSLSGRPHDVAPFPPGSPSISAVPLVRPVARWIKIFSMTLVVSASNPLLTGDGGGSSQGPSPKSGADDGAELLERLRRQGSAGPRTDFGCRATSFQLPRPVSYLWFPRQDEDFRGRGLPAELGLSGVPDQPLDVLASVSWDTARAEPPK